LGFFLGFGGALDLALATVCGVDFDDADVEFMMH
jgi:oligosaccharyltransferase complex subunit beta